jgi:transglutaminase/protease-like cytokinesis protein 3
VDNSLIKNTTTEIPFCYVGGNNQIIQFKYFSQQTQDININQKKKTFDIKYININSKIAKFNVQGELINRCKGNWSINLTNEEIDSLIPNDFKMNKIHFNKIANDIIKEYDAEHKNDLIVVHSVVKIGKWVKKNIKYDITYVGTNDITASETLNNKRGVCHHITKLFNALMYSLGYQTIYILGYALDNKINYGIEDAHAWSLVKIDGKWLPFDATWGIFSGKLPITHIFKQTDCQGIKTLSYDKVKVEQINVKGNLC